MSSTLLSTFQTLSYSMLTRHPGGKHCYPHFAEENRKAQTGQETCSGHMTEPGTQPSASPRLLTTLPCCLFSKKHILFSMAKWVSPEIRFYMLGQKIPEGWRGLKNKTSGNDEIKNSRGAPGWLSQLSLRLWLRT